MHRIVLLVCLVAVAGGAEPFQDPKLPPEQRIDDLLQRLTVEEKAALCHGDNGAQPQDRFFSGGVPRLGVPKLSFRDGPVGVRTFDRSPATALPATLALACTWDRTAAAEYGQVLAEEMLASHRQVLFGPGLNLMRDPRGGRNFEYMGEDPFLTGTLGAEYIRAVQRQGVAADAKHLVANDYERRRHFTSANLDERTLRELHFLPFELAVRDGHVWTVMTGNNLVNGLHASNNPPLLHDLLKERIGFDGVVLTDWRAAYETVPTALAGTDMTTGLCAYVFGEGRLLAAVKSGAVPVAMLDDKVRRVLRLYLRVGLLDANAAPRPGAIDTPEHRATARRLAARGIVLLKNDGNLLPLDRTALRRVFVTGPGAEYVAFGRGSGQVYSAFKTTPLEALKRELGTAAEVRHAAWAPPGAGRRGKADAFQRVTLTAEQLAEAKAADVVVFCAVDEPHGESEDLDGLELPGGQAAAIAALAKANPKTVILLQTGQPVLTEEFVDAVPALLAGWYLGQAAGDAFTDVLFGRVNPSARLACTFGRHMADYPCEALSLWPPRAVLDRQTWDAGMTDADRRPTYGFAADYKEGVFIGYRWFDARKIEPRFPFGYGLSYTTFAFSDLNVTPDPSGWRATCTVRNTGSRAGAEVVQLYVAPERPAVSRPMRELRGFTRVELQPGEARQVTITLRPTAFAYFDAATHVWRTDPGRYGIEVGASSRDLPLRSAVTIDAAATSPWY